MVGCSGLGAGVGLGGQAVKRDRARGDTQVDSVIGVQYASNARNGVDALLMEQWRTVKAVQCAEGGH